MTDYSSNRMNGQAARRQAVSKRKKTRDWPFIGLCVFIVALLLGGLYGCQAYFASTRDVTVKVNKTGQTCTHGKCTNLVYTDHGTFKNSDSFAAMKFNSSDITGGLCPGGVYKLKVRGYRIPVLSEWPNILEIESVVTPPPANLGCG